MLVEGVTIRLLDDGLLPVITVTTIKRDAVDLLAEWISRRIEHWDPKIPYCALYDLTQPGAMITPYMRKVTAALNDQRQEVHGRVALIMRRDTTASLLSMFTMVRQGSTRELRVFFSVEEGLQWLRELSSPG
jgi:hypothetical protein